VDAITCCNTWHFVSVIFLQYPYRGKQSNSTDDVVAPLLAISSLFIAIPLSLYFQKRQFRRLGPVKYLRSQLWRSKILCGEESPQVALILYRIGLVHEILNEPEDAFEAYRSIVSTIPDASKHPGGALVHHAAGRMALALRRYDEALEYFETALLLRELNPRNTLRVTKELYAIASTYERIGNLKLALEKRTQALERLHERGLSQSMDAARCLTLIGTTFQSMEKLDEALEKLNEALAIYILNVGDYPSVGAIACLYEKIGEVHANRGDVSTAIENFHLAIEVHRRGGKSDENREVSSLLQKAADLEHEFSV